MEPPQPQQGGTGVGEDSSTRINGRRVEPPATLRTIRDALEPELVAESTRDVEDAGPDEIRGALARWALRTPGGHDPVEEERVARLLTGDMTGSASPDRDRPPRMRTVRTPCRMSLRIASTGDAGAERRCLGEESSEAGDQGMDAIARSPRPRPRLRLRLRLRLPKPGEITRDAAQNRFPCGSPCPRPAPRAVRAP
ncbi:hypothetical protein [Streptomyces albipurpureus]|uniref:Uncharacterized protein n=1 Tax=Streptomyces albipurpureus TaxID=2897419 RepID=A0ABT0UJD9_9ACTN|nr:hypothetical protein [Streptomyces sp. CWNU-1]MCM2388608.1 hypothetical protein [Streptomyces sp. CWNU-1]